MNTEAIFNKFQSLPQRYQRQLAEYIDFLFNKHKKTITCDNKEFAPEKYRGVLSFTENEIEKEITQM